jgi:hypothetical protein
MPPMRSLLFSLLALGACAQAEPGHFGTEHVDGGNTHPDAQGQHVDAFVNTIDAPPGQQTKTLDDNSSDTLDTTHSLACGTNDSMGNTLNTNANNFYRVFDPSAFGITTDFHINQVAFQVIDCESNAGNGMKVTVDLGTFTGTTTTMLTAGQLTSITTKTGVQVPEIDGTGGTVNVPITATIPAGQKLYAEVDAPAGATSEYFYMGMNLLAETSPSYVDAPSCNINVPTTAKSLNTNTTISILLTVTGTY